MLGRNFLKALTLASTLAATSEGASAAVVAQADVVVLWDTFTIDLVDPLDGVSTEIPSIDWEVQQDSVEAEVTFYSGPTDRGTTVPQPPNPSGYTRDNWNGVNFEARYLPEDLVAQAQTLPTRLNASARVALSEPNTGAEAAARVKRVGTLTMPTEGLWRFSVDYTGSLDLSTDIKGDDAQGIIDAHLSVAGLLSPPSLVDAFVTDNFVSNGEDFFETYSGTLSVELNLVANQLVGVDVDALAYAFGVTAIPLPASWAALAGAMLSLAALGARHRRA